MLANVHRVIKKQIKYNFKENATFCFFSENPLLFSLCLFTKKKKNNLLRCKNVIYRF